MIGTATLVAVAFVPFPRAASTTVASGSRSTTTAMGMPKLHGTPQSRSPLVNWFCHEADIEFEMLPPRPSPHPFGQVPCLVDDEDVVLFESGAILLYLNDEYGAESPTAAKTKADKASMLSWVVWANSELDGLCFGAVPGDHRVRGTAMDRPDVKGVANLERILTDKEWLVGNRFSVADAAVGSYLNYVPIFFPQANLGATPAIAKYMQRCAQRPAFARAFGEQHAGLVQSKTEEWLSSGGGGSGPTDMLKSLFG
eukprot:CAMPEP_0115849034 /NCGR_PEP_ID=MMETSP0287-20121206/11239_1 /TAXON_ID=412157 /ORGANISM="Chrysochromulina rotalis, Strain UIO044" /LENGTH=254 /DNA_ID=CAMNT_0003302985 /DNA_START=11 /DNA_END=775 /DNA_ORIENTATION=-